MISIALIDDHEITRKGIKTIVELNPNIKVVLEASNGKELLEKLNPAQLPLIAILDINMPVMNGFETVRKLQAIYPSIQIIVFSLIYEEDAVINMITSGARGYIPKSADPSTIAKAIISVNTKGFYLGELVKRGYFQKKTTSKEKYGFAGKHYLSPKEIKFMKLSSTNLNYKEIAEIMEVSIKTLENYRDSLFDKLEIKNRAALALYGFKTGLVSIFQE